MSNSAWCDSNSKSHFLKLYDMCTNAKCKCQNQITFAPRQFHLEGTGFKNTNKKGFKGSHTVWNKFPKPAVNTTAPVIGVVLSVKSKMLRWENLLRVF